MNIEFLDKIKRLTIAALVSDEMLMNILVLKGGNALGLAYDLSNRGSIDIDFSMEGDFSEKEKSRLLQLSKDLLEKEFLKENLAVIDVRLTEKPKNIDISVQNFWGGYLLEFKIAKKEIFDKFYYDTSTLIRNAISLHSDNSTKFTVDISKYEYVGKARPKDIDGVVVHVYSPEMLALEKLRALCQQVEEYRQIVKRMTPKSRARDFYDIHNLLTSFKIDLKTEENILLAHNIFAAKRVPLEFIRKIKDYRDLHFQSWNSVLQTINQNEKVSEFNYYFDFVINQFTHLS